MQGLQEPFIVFFKSIYFWFHINTNHANLRKVPLSHCQVIYGRECMPGKQIFRKKCAKLVLTSNKLSPRRTEDVSFVLFAHQGNLYSNQWEKLYLKKRRPIKLLSSTTRRKTQQAKPYG